MHLVLSMAPLDLRARPVRETKNSRPRGWGPLEMGSAATMPELSGDNRHNTSPRDTTVYRTQTQTNEEQVHLQAIKVTVKVNHTHSQTLGLWKHAATETN